jgi:hypothetical protein
MASLKLKWVAVASIASSTVYVGISIGARRLNIDKTYLLDFQSRSDHPQTTINDLPAGLWHGGRVGVARYGRPGPALGWRSLTTALRVPTLTQPVADEKHNDSRCRTSSSTQLIVENDSGSFEISTHTHIHDVGQIVELSMTSARIKCEASRQSEYSRLGMTPR